MQQEKKKKRKKDDYPKNMFSLVIFAIYFGNWEIKFLFLLLFARMTQTVPVSSVVIQWHRSQCGLVFQHSLCTQHL